MYALYKVDSSDAGKKFRYFEKTSLVGCNNGILAKYLKDTLGPSVSEPHTWEIDIDDAVKTLYPKSDAFVIDVRPKDPETISLFQLVKAWGYSSYGWTPLLLRLRELHHGVPVSEYDKDSFFVEDDEEKSTVHSITYVRGSIEDGDVTGTWNFPGSNQTAALLWQNHFEFFKQQIEDAYN